MDEQARGLLAQRFLALAPEKRETFLSRLRDAGLSASDLPIPSTPALLFAPLTHAQERLWFLWRLAPDSAAYNVAGALRLRGPLELPALHAALDQIVSRHESLRSEVYEDAGQAWQRVTDARLPQLQVMDLAHSAAPLTAAEIRAHELMRAPFDLTRAPLLRAAVLRLGAQDHVLVLSVHHIAADGWSLDIVLRELAAGYAARREGRALAWPEPALRYLDYARFSRAVQTDAELQRGVLTLRGGLGDIDSTLELPLIGERPEDPGDAACSIHVQVPAALVARLQELARVRSCTLFTVLLSSYALLLRRHSGQRLIRVGVPVANRSRSQLQDVVGMFVNTLVVPLEVRGGTRFSDYLAHVEREFRGRQALEDLPFERLVEALAPARSVGRNPLFQALFNHQQRDHSALGALPGLRAELLPWGTSAAQVDLALDTEQVGETGLRARFTYARALLSRVTVERMAEHWLSLLEAASAEPARMSCELAPEPVQRTAAEVTPAYVPVTELIWEQARKRPDAPALCDDDGAHALSYAQLAERVRQLAAALRAQVSAHDEVSVAVQLERSSALIVAELAVLEAGFAFVPVDPALPAARVQELLTAARSQLLWCDEGAPQADVRTVTTRMLTAHDAAGRSCQRPHPEQIAYVIFTSGSTGAPKGVAMTHGSLSMHCRAVAARYGMTPRDSALHFAAASFDASIEQWVSPLLSGAKLVVRGPELYSAERALDVLRERGISWFEMPPAYLVEVCRAALERGETLALRACSVGGEALSRQGFELIMRALAGAPLINGYGPTETAITPLTWTAQPTDSFDCPYAPIGAPVGERTAYVLDADLCPVPHGVIGELYLGAGGLARGYFDRPALSAERFLPDPFHAAGGRMYRTGDRVRSRDDGQLEFLGRSDHQVKLRGHRIELGEIESRLLACPGVREAVVLTQGGARVERLIAYVGTGDADADRSQALRESLEAQLPAYMVPSAIVCLPELPRTVSGKVDRRALPEPARADDRARTAPLTAAERALAEVFRQVLKIAELSVDDNFFALGGDSIVALQLISRARAAGWALTPKDIFVHQSLGALAAAARPLKAAPQPQVDLACMEGELPLSPIAHAFFAQPFVLRDHYNQALLLAVDAPLDLRRLSRALDAVVAHHDALRLRFVVSEGGEVSQRYIAQDPHRGTLLRTAAVTEAHELESMYADTQRSLDLARGPLLRALHVQRANGTTRLLLVVHHLVIDGVSWRILMEDLLSAYQQLTAADEVRLPPRTAPWAAFTHALATWAQDEHRLEVERSHYRAQLAGVSAELPVRGERRDALARDRAFVELKLGRELTTRLLRDAPAAYRTHIHELLLTALARALHALTGRQRALIELESHGRQGAELAQPPLDLSRTLGWFTCLYPVCLDASGPLEEAIVRVKEELRAVPHGGLGYGLLAQHAREPLQLPAARITFNYQGQFGAESDAVSGLRPVREPSGPLCDPLAPLGNWLEINGQVFAQELAFTFAYSQAIHAPETIEALRDRFAAELEAVVDHTSACARSVLSPSDLTLRGLSESALAQLSAAYPELCDVYPLTPLQRGLLFQSLLTPDLATYLAQMDVRVERLDVERFLAAFHTVLARHESMRAAFVHEGLDEPVQVISSSVQVPVERHDLRGLAGHTLDARLHELRDAERARGLPLTAAPLMRLCIAHLDGDAHQVIWTHHHLLLDGWSTSVLWSEVVQEYAGLARVPNDASYRDYLAWLGARDQAASERYFREVLARAGERTALTTAVYAQPDPARPHHQKLRLQLAAAETERLRSFARRERVTVHGVVQAAFGLLLQRYTDGTGAVFGVTVAGRPPELAGSESLLGLLINTVPVYVSAHAQESVHAFVQRVQRENAELREHEHAPLYEIQRWAGRPGEPLFDALLVFENYPRSTALEAHAAALGFGRIHSVEHTHYPLTLAVRLDRELTLDLGFTPALPVELVRGLGERLVSILDQFASDPERALGQLAIFGARQRAARHPTCTQALPLAAAQIAAHALQHADAPALRGPTGALSYGALRAQVSQLAGELWQRGVRAEQRVGVLCGRSTHALLSVLAIWEIGAAFVPLDAELPTERRAYMLEDAGVSALVTTRALHARADECAPQAVARIDVEDALSSAAPLPAATHVHADQLAYVLYTSGTTGKPKGVAVTHGALAAHCAAMAARYEARAQDRVLLFASLSFDAAFDQWLVPLTQGAEVHVMDALWAPERMHAEALARGLTWLNTPPSYMSQLARAAAERGPLPQLRLAVVGGEAVSVQALTEITRALQPARLLNAYGPTEAVVTASTWQAGTPALASASAPLGAATADRVLHVLDAQLEQVPHGVAGELFISGSVLARGYHARAALTAEHFLPASGGGRVYRTGDRARILPDGTLEFLGRRDQQVKLRGVRVELGELEAALRAQAGVEDAAALVRELQGAQVLFAVVAAGKHALDARALREAVRRKLPAQLWPAQVTVLEALPRTAAGKVDRAALEALPLARRAHRPPETDTEKVLAGLFEELLSVTALGLDDEFFELGGDSLLAMRLCARVKQALGVDLSLPALFESPSLAALAARVSCLQPTAAVQDQISAALDEVADLDPEALSALLLTLDEEST